jgi:chromate reductase, NAD(P)H dehydrogenase (quinone)
MITIISGTNRANSKTYLLSSYYKTKLEEKGEKVELISLNSLPSNFIESDLYGKRSPEFAKIQELVTASTKFLFVLPEYNGSFPGILKLFIDACTFPESFKGKKAALLGHSNGKYGNIRGVEHFTGVCNYIGLTVLPLRIHIPYIQHELNEENNLFKEDTLRFTNQQIEELIRF